MFMDTIPTVENQMEQKMENVMDNVCSVPEEY